MVEHDLAKVETGVRFPPPAPTEFPPLWRPSFAGAPPRREPTPSMLGIFSKITRKNIIHEKIERSEAGLYFYLVFPIAFSFLLTFGIARLISYWNPGLTISFIENYRIHHFVYGFFVLAISGYLALIHNGPRARYLIALLYGLGLGLAFDEFAFWIRLTDDDPARWSYDGFLIIIGLFFLILSASRGVKMLRFLWPFGRK